jgi:hypothetical protein
VLVSGDVSQNLPSSLDVLTACMRYAFVVSQVAVDIAAHC